MLNVEIFAQNRNFEEIWGAVEVLAKRNSTSIAMASSSKGDSSVENHHEFVDDLERTVQRVLVTGESRILTPYIRSCEGSSQGSLRSVSLPNPGHSQCSIAGT